MNTLWFVISCLAGAILCAGFMVFISERNKKMLTATFDEENDVDIFEEIANYKKKQLKKKPWAMSYKTYGFISSGSALFLMILCYLVFGNIWMIILGTVIGVCVPEGIMMFQESNRKSMFEERFARSLRQLSASLKSGRSIQQAVEDLCASEFIHESVKTEYQQLSADLRFGIPVQEAFERFASRVHCQDAKDVSVAVAMQMRVGGREAQVIESIAKSISSRMMTRKETKSLFAGANTTVLVMDVLPFGIIAVLSLFGTYMAPMFQKPMLTVLFIGMLIFMGIGSVVTHKMIDKLRKGCGL